MKRKALILISSILLSLAAAGLLQPLKVFAASGAIGFLIEEPEVQVNQTFSVYLTIEADVPIGDFECYLYYDENKLQYRTGADSVAGGDGFLKVSVSNATTSADNKKILMKFIALAPGTVVFSATAPKLYDFESGKALSLSATDATVSIVAKPDASDDALLKSLRISPGSISPAFSPEITKYTAEVTKETASIYVSAIANDSKASVGIYGYDHLYPGENTVTILVTAENGSIKEYTITVKRAENTAPSATPTSTPSPIPTEAPPPAIKEFEWKLESFEQGGRLFVTGNYQFEVLDSFAGFTLPAGFVKTKMMISGHNITVYAPETTEVTDFVIMALKREGGEAGLYRYDRVEKTIQRFVKEDVVVKREDEGTVSEEILDRLNSYQNTVSLLGLGIAVAVALWLLTCLALIYMIKKSKGYDDLDE